VAAVTVGVGIVGKVAAAILDAEVVVAAAAGVGCPGVVVADVAAAVAV
jgi:hypothetical protein